MPHVLRFQQPSCGAKRDVRELEYVSALHQCERDGPDASAAVSAASVAALVRSRHGVVVDDPSRVAALVDDLAGPFSSSRSSSRCCRLDVPQLVAALLAPKLKAEAGRLERGDSSSSRAFFVSRFARVPREVRARPRRDARPSSSR